MDVHGLSYAPQVSDPVYVATFTITECAFLLLLAYVCVCVRAYERVYVRMCV